MRRRRARLPGGCWVRNAAKPSPDYGESTHASFGGSSASRWLACPGSHHLIEALKAEARRTETPWDTSSEYARIGTWAHDVAACLLKGYLSKPPSDMPEDLQDAVWTYVRRVRALPAARLLLETRVPFPTTPEQFGTVDAAVLDYATHRGYVLDAKFGVATPVKAATSDGVNPQLLYYAVGIREAFDPLHEVREWHLGICQPRALDETCHETWALASNVDLDAFLDRAQTAITAALEPDAPRIPSKAACRWCPGKDSCREYQDRLLKFFPAITDGGGGEGVDIT